jgi:hypothetical protein
MAYSDSVKIRAYSLFIQGTAHEEIARILRKEFGITISAGTVRNWAETKDSRGMTWEEQRSAIRSTVQHNIEVSGAARLSEIREKVGTIQEKLYEQLISKKAPKIGSFEGAVYAFRTIADFGVKLDQKASEEINVLVVIQTMLEIFAEVPEIRKVIQKHWKHVENEIKVRIMHEEPVAEPIEIKKITDGD